MNSICGCRSSKTRVSNDLEYTSEDEYHSIDLSHTLIHHQHEEEEEGEQENDSNQVTDKKRSHRVIFIGDANIGKYNCFEALNDLKEDEDEECSKKKGIINISIRSGSQLVFSHIEGLEEDPLLRKWKYRKIEVFVLFFSLTSMESLISLAYKWAPEVQNVITHIEKNQIKAIICIVGLYDERSHAEDSNRIHQNVIDSLKGMLSADIYIEVSKNYSVEELSQMVTRIEDQLYFESPSNQFPIKSYSDESSSDEDESSQCPFYGNESCNIPHPSGNVNNDEIFNKKCIIVSRPKQEELKKQIMGLRNRGKATVVSDIALNIDVKEEQNQIIEQIQTILEYKAEEVTNCSVRNLKDNELFNSYLLSSHSEQTLLYKRKFLVEEMPNPPWNVSAWNKKSFKHFIHQKISLEDEIEVRGKLKHGFQHLSAANNCFSPVIPKKYLKQFEVVLLQCIHALSRVSTLNAISVFDFFLLCKFNLVECIKYLIYRYPKGFGYLMMSFSEETGGTPHPICFLEDESIVLKIMQIYHPNLYSTRKDWKGYNILHYCADKNFINAIILFLEFDQQDVIFSLLHMNDSSSPIAVAAQSGNENIARIMYNYLDSNITDDQFLSFFRFNEFKSTSLLRICSQQKLHCLLKDIINSFEKRGISNELLPFLTVQNKVDGERTLLQNIQSESILIKLIPLYLKNDSRNLLLKCKKEKHLGHYLAEKNYSKILLTIHQHCTNNNLNDLFFFDFLLSPNKYGDDCCKLAAWKGSNEFLVTALSLCRGLNKSYLSLLLHGTNQNQENLMELLLFQQRSLIVPRQIIMLMEKEVHSDNKILILSCYRVHISPSEELVSLIEDTEKLLPLSNTKKTLICLKKIIILIFSLLLFCLDIGFDISLAIQYYKDSDEACKHDFTDYSSQSLLEEESNFHRATRYVGALCSSTRFYVTLLFIISPWLFYIFEFIRETFINDRPMWIVHVPFKEIKLTSYRSNEQQAILLNAKAVQLMDKRLKWRSIFGCCSSFNNFCTNLLFIFGFISEFVVTIAFWPIISMFRLFYADVMYDIQHGIKKIKARELKVSATKICSRARLIEALLESSFQPIIQLYIVFPILINNITSDKSIDLSRDLYLEASQFGSAITSITTLSWAITLYQSNIKGGALDLTVNFLGRIILLISNLFLITGRMLLFIVFAYGFGAGRLIGLIIFIIIHIIASTILIHYWRDPSFTITSKITYFINCVINGFGNTYLHMWIQLPQNLISEAKSGKSTFVRHLLFETIFFLELISMITFTYFMLDSRIAEAIQLKYLTLLIFGLYFIGNALKIFYYKTQHIWNELISIERDIKRLALRVFG